MPLTSQQQLHAHVLTISICARNCIAMASQPTHAHALADLDLEQGAHAEEAVIGGGQYDADVQGGLEEPIGPELLAGQGAPSTFAAMNSRMLSIAKSWISKRPLPSLFALRLLLCPLCKLLGTFVEKSGRSWDFEQRPSRAQADAMGVASGQYGRTNDTPLLHKIRLVAEQDFFVGLQKLMDHKTWAHLDRSVWVRSFHPFASGPPLEWVAWFMSYLCKSAVPTHTNSKLLDSPELLDEIIQDKACLLDDFSAAFLEQYPAEMACSPPALAVLEAVAKFSSTDISTKADVTICTDTPTHTGVLEWTNAVSKIQAEALGSEQARGYAGGLLAHAPKVEVQPARDVPKARRGGGGSWRAFTSAMTRGFGVAPDWSSLGQQYRDAKLFLTEEYQSALQIGHAATVKHKTAPTGHGNSGSSFGPKPRDLRRKLRAPAIGGQQPSLALPSSSGDMLQVVEGTSGVTLQVALRQSLFELRSKLRKAAMAKSNHKRLGETMLSKYVEEKQPKVISKLLDMEPALQPWKEALHLHPSVGTLTFQVCFNSIEKALMLGSTAETSSGMWRRELQRCWAELNSVVKTLEMDGQVAHHIMKRLVNCLKELVPRKDPQGTCAPSGPVGPWAENGPFSLELIGNKPIAARSGWSDLADEDVDEGAFAKEKKFEGGSHFLHVGLQYLMPYRPTFQELQVVSWHGDSLVTLKQTGEFKTAFQVASAIHSASSWKLQLWAILRAWMLIVVWLRSWLIWLLSGLHHPGRNPTLWSQKEES
eukprot:6107962-Amphidinium_carterae.2